MADTKITALTALTGADPANDVIPIVDVNDFTMAASGTTKKISVNNILGAGGTATLASATITGDLTVDTSTLKVDSANNRVGIGTATPAEALTVAGKIRSVSSTFGLSDVIAETTAGTGTGYARLIVKTADREWRLINDASTSGSPFIIYDATANAESLRIATAGVYTFGDGAGGTRMTLNSTGLGVGGSPLGKLTIASGNTATASWGIASIYSTDSMAVDKGGSLVFGGSFTGSTATYFAQIAGRKENSTDADVAGYLAFSTRPTGGLTTERMRIDSSGNVISNVTGTAPTLATNSQMVFNLTSNTNLRISVRGTDGTTRTANITLA